MITTLITKLFYSRWFGLHRATLYAEAYRQGRFDESMDSAYVDVVDVFEEGG